MPPKFGTAAWYAIMIMGGHCVIDIVFLCCLQLTGTLPAYLSTMKVISEVSTLHSRCTTAWGRLAVPHCTLTVLVLPFRQAASLGGLYCTHVLIQNIQ